MMMVFLENVYYIIVVTWTLFYLFKTFTDLPSLPWSDCSKGSRCSSIYMFHFLSIPSLDETWANAKCWSPESGVPFNQSMPFLNGYTESESETAVEQFWK